MAWKCSYIQIKCTANYFKEGSQSTNVRKIVALLLKRQHQKALVKYPVFTISPCDLENKVKSQSQNSRNNIGHYGGLTANGKLRAVSPFAHHFTAFTV